MPKYYCDYCDIYLTHDSLAVRRSHNAGWRHQGQVRNHYAEIAKGYTQMAIGQMIRPPGPPPPPMGMPFPPPPFPPGMRPPYQHNHQQQQQHQNFRPPNHHQNQFPPPSQPMSR